MKKMKEVSSSERKEPSLRKCQWCGNAIEPVGESGYSSVDGKRKWYHPRWGYWCRDSTGKRRAPKPVPEEEGEANKNEMS